MRKILTCLMIAFVTATAAISQTTECPANTVCISPEAARTALKNSDLVEAQKKELAILTQAIADLKELTASIKIELARATGEKTQLEATLIRYNALIDVLLKGQRRRCIFSICLGG